VTGCIQDVGEYSFRITNFSTEFKAHNLEGRIDNHYIIYQAFPKFPTEDKTECFNS
jgi:hypothetical protein